jgi:hypothetical protein
VANDVTEEAVAKRKSIDVEGNEQEQEAVRKRNLEGIEEEIASPGREASMSKEKKNRGRSCFNR